MVDVFCLYLMYLFFNSETRFFNVLLINERLQTVFQLKHYSIYQSERYREKQIPSALCQTFMRYNNND